MDEKKAQSGAEEAFEKGAQAAHAIRGAVKTGKTITHAAKGAAAGGPFGTVAGVLWSNRKLVGKALAAAGLLLMMPILFIMMLPSMIFGDLDAPEVSDILNNNAAITANIETADSTVRSVLISAHDALIAVIESEIAEIAPGDTHYINDCREQILFDAVLIISQYCSSKDNYRFVSVGDLEAVVRENADKLFDYTVEAFDRENPDTGEPYRHYEYTVTYKGDSYFSDHVFYLADEQKARSEGYAANLNLFLNEGSHQAQGNTHAKIKEALPAYPYAPSGTWESPFPGESWKANISSPYGSREDPINHKTAFHAGVDIAYPKGTPISAVKDGIVAVANTASRNTGYGYHVAIHHGGGFVTLYAHCDALLVRPGQHVSAGDVIAKVGATGRVTGPHLHMEVVKDGELANPMLYIKE